MSEIYLLWDESHLWGLLARRALVAFGLPHRVVRAQAIAQGLLASKPPALLVAPGGVARRKAELLGPPGMAAVRAYVEAGGAYLGFCGGAGLGLTGEHGLDLCPWGRAAFTDRLLHLVSGHMRVETPTESDLVPPGFAGRTAGQGPSLPVWWPARFEPEKNDACALVAVLATYERPGEDFWVADLPYASLPEGTFAEVRERYNVAMGPALMRGHPCMVSGGFGKGRYLVSYAHLETPGSADANAWLAHIIRTLSNLGPACDMVPAWPIRETPVVWDDPVLAELLAAVIEIEATGREHFLLFERNDWLLGWRAGLPGAHLNHLGALAREAAAHAPGDAALAWWAGRGEAFGRVLTAFRERAQGYLLAERLAMTLSKSAPEALSQEALKAQRVELFGRPMEQGGLYAELLSVLDELVFLQLRDPV